jgi:hypothetical protein
MRVLRQFCLKTRMDIAHAIRAALPQIAPLPG